MRNTIWVEKNRSEMNFRYFNGMIIYTNIFNIVLKFAAVGSAATGPTSLLVNDNIVDAKHVAIFYGYLSAILGIISVPLSKYIANLKLIHSGYCDLHSEWEKLWLKINNGTVKQIEITNLLTKKGGISKRESNVPRIGWIVARIQKSIIKAQTHGE